MRTKKAFLNMIWTAAALVVSLVCGFVLSRITLVAFGSDTKGLVASATQFIGYTTLLESGVGGVTRAALYKALAGDDKQKVAGILKATTAFFHKIALLFLAYVVILALAFPHMVSSEKSDVFIIGIVAVMALSSFVQSYLGAAASLYLQADQRMYIIHGTTVATTIATTILSGVMIWLGFGIHAIKLMAAAVLFVRPVVFNRYLRRVARIPESLEADNDAIRERWSGLAHHIAWTLNSNTDIVVLTLFLDIKEVAVYSIYHMIAIGVASFNGVVCDGLVAGIGDMIAKGEKEALGRVLAVFELMVSVVAISSLVTAFFLFIPFVRIYTSGVEDVNYLRPAVAALMCAAFLVQCFRSVYENVVIAAGHYRQTRGAAITEAILNVALSLLLVVPLGIPGVLIATIIAMTFRMVHFALHLSRNILGRKISFFVWRMVFNLAIVAVLCVIDLILPLMEVNGYLAFALDGAILLFVNAAAAFGINALFFRSDVSDLFKRVRTLFTRTSAGREG